MDEKLNPEINYMRRAIALARQGAGRTNPNPMVGAVIVKDGHIIGEGYHQHIGGLHAERNALASCTEDAAGATMYVTLEPCCHYGKTPPCTEAILEHHIARVVIGSHDPNPKVAGKGVAMLRSAGVQITEDFLREECDALNPVFFHYIQNKTPYVALKYAMTADGKIATRSGASQWITGETARTHVHQLRNYYKGILVGIGTVLQDNPLLTCRIPDGRNPIRIVCDSHLRIPLDCRLCNTAKDVPLLVACTEDPDGKQAALEKKGAQVLFVESRNGRLSIPALLQKLYEQEIDGLLVEGGSTIHAAFLTEGQVQHIYAYVGAKIFGGTGSATPVGGTGIEAVADCVRLTNLKTRTFDTDILLEYDVRR